MVVIEISRAGRLNLQALVPTPRNTHLAEYLRQQMFWDRGSRVPGAPRGDRKGQLIQTLFLDVMMIKELRSFPEPLFYFPVPLYCWNVGQAWWPQGVLAGMEPYQG